MFWTKFDAKNPPAPGDYWCEVPALKLEGGGCLCRALYWTGERWDGPGGEYEVGRYVPEALPQLHGHGVVCEMDEGRDQWRLDAAIARIRELESERDAMALRIARLSVEIAKPEDKRLRDVTEAMDGRAVMLDDIAARVRHELCELDTWIARAGTAERKWLEATRQIADLCVDRHMDEENMG